MRESQPSVVRLQRSWPWAVERWDYRYGKEGGRSLKPTPRVSRLPARPAPVFSAGVIRRGALRSSSSAPIPLLFCAKVGLSLAKFWVLGDGFSPLESCFFFPPLYILLFYILLGINRRSWRSLVVACPLLQDLERKAEREVQCSNGGRLCISLSCSRWEAEPEARA